MTFIHYPIQMGSCSSPIYIIYSIHKQGFGQALAEYL